MRLIAAAAILLIAFGCTRKPAPTMPAGPGVGEKLVDVQLETLDGKMAMLCDFTRGKVAVVKFGATWCPWCTRQLRDLNEIAKSFPSDKVAIVQIDVAEDRKRVEADNAENHVAFPTLLDPQSTAADRYDVDVIPDVIIVGHDGTIVFRSGYTTAVAIRRVVQSALKAMSEAQAEPSMPK